MICAGDESLFNEIKDTQLSLTGKASFYLGEIGNGSRMKLAVNMVMGTWLTSASLLTCTFASQR
jgi:3-hydroxyisobutyrate dehydrogenase-like beta-hydroxyacid dehydrogenase